MSALTPFEPKGQTSLEHLDPRKLRPYANNARTHSRKQIKLIASSIERFGFTNPVLLSDDDEIIAGHGRVEAAIALGMEHVPALRLSHLSADERRAYVLADNRLAEHAGWDQDILAIELQALVDIDFDLTVTGFELAEVDLVLDQAARHPAPDVQDTLPLKASGPVATQFGDLWALGDHRLLCGDARAASDLAHLVGTHRMDMIFTDPPYNVAIDGHVCGSGAIQHKEFAFASGEMDAQAFTQFLTQTLLLGAGVCKDGAIAFVCMDWRHMRELLDAGAHAFTELKNLCVWNKTNAGMGTFYRSKHELVFVFKIGTAAHINSFGLGETGRYRTNVWDYAGVNVPSGEAKSALAMHPTVKPVAMVADALRDCSRRGSRVLDPFAGSGTTLIAAESCGRIAHVLEYEPEYCDVILRRYVEMTGSDPIHIASGETFSARLASARALARTGEITA
jgi:DNA modification methylase